MDLSVFFNDRAIWFWPFGFGIFVFGLMLLAPGSLPAAMERWMLPSLAVYLIAIGNVIFWKELYHRRYMERVGEVKNLETRPVVGFAALHGFLLVAFIWYNACKGVF